MPDPASPTAGHAQAGFRVPRVRTFASLKYPNYRYLWAGTFFTSAGDWIQQVTLGWLIYDPSGSAVLVGALQARGRVMSISLLNFAMTPLGSFAAGLLAHRWGTPMAMLIGGLVGAVTLAVIGFRFRGVLGSREATSSS